jgi:hypothetical protein
MQNVTMQVIEHFPKGERTKLLRFICRYLRPKRFVLTTPNGDYNKFIPNLNDNGFRHPGHHIEFTPNEFEEQVRLEHPSSISLSPIALFLTDEDSIVDQSRRV